MTWGFFESFVGPMDNWLPPDNYQAAPEGKVAHRTSPTNKGLLLLSTLAAHDLGYLGLGNLTDRLEKTFDTLDRLERCHGHFYNWYDTVSLQPLRPAYVSTVDSGNLAACLITLKQGLTEVIRKPWSGSEPAAGLTDTFGVITRLLRDTALDVVSERGQRLQRRSGALERILSLSCADLHQRRAWLVARAAARREAGQRRRLYPVGGSWNPIDPWMTRFATQARDALNELDILTPWIALAGRLRAAQRRFVREPTSRGALETSPAPTNRSCVGHGPGREAGLAGFGLGRSGEGPGRQNGGVDRQAGGSGAARGAGPLIARCRRLAERADALAAAMDFTVLYRPERHLFAIGYTPAQGRLDSASYDLLASEARLTSFLAIARGAAPRKHWFHLGRLVTRIHGESCLLSWGGTMFEYLMPELILPCYPDTLLDESRRAAVVRQMEYGRQRGVPWGISESGYAQQNASLDYQYQAFGVPGLGLKRGLANDLVVAPYATALAATVCPRDAVVNLQRLAAEGGLGAHGFYEAIDYTAERLPAGRRSMTVRSFMAHHQGMSLVALVNCLLDDPMPRRFHAEPMVRAADLLLQERVPFTIIPEEPSKAEAAAPPPGRGSRRPQSAPDHAGHARSAHASSVQRPVHGHGDQRRRRLRRLPRLDGQPLA